MRASSSATTTVPGCSAGVVRHGPQANRPWSPPSRSRRPVDLGPRTQELLHLGPLDPGRGTLGRGRPGVRNRPLVARHRPTGGTAPHAAHRDHEPNCSESVDFCQGGLECWARVASVPAWSPGTPRAERMSSNLIQCGFESHPGHTVQFRCRRSTPRSRRALGHVQTPSALEVLAGSATLSEASRLTGSQPFDTASLARQPRSCATRVPQV